jgi:limonene-1,2-epoxide hydrolase
MLEIDDQGLVLRWRDYFDLREIDSGQTAPQG